MVNLKSSSDFFFLSRFQVAGGLTAARFRDKELIFFFFFFFVARCVRFAFVPFLATFSSLPSALFCIFCMQALLSGAPCSVQKGEAMRAQLALF